MVYMVFDNPDDKDNMTFLSDYDTSSIQQLYPEMQCKSVKQMLSFCRSTLKRTSNGDTIICWYDFMGVLLWWLCTLQHKKRKIVILNILLKDKNTLKNKVAQLLYKPALRAKNVTATVTSNEYGAWLNKRLGLHGNYTLLHDIYHSNYATAHSAEIQKGSVFCGGRNSRNWKLIIEVAKEMPDVHFRCVMPQGEYERHSPQFSKNIDAKYDIPQKQFLNMLTESEIVIMPLDTEAPAGLIALFQAAANRKMVIASNTMTIREYLGNGRGALCDSDKKEWVRKIRYYLEHSNERKQCADAFQKFLETECSERHYAEVLMKLI